MELQNLRKEYLAGTLDEKQTDPNPFRQFQTWLYQAEEAGIREPNAMILSTCPMDGHVSSRVVLLKGVENEKFLFFSNYKSRKGRDLGQNVRASLLFFWDITERQVRIEGITSKLSRKESVAYFNSRPVESRISAIISPQSRVIPGRDYLENKHTEYLADPGSMALLCPPHWGGYGLSPDYFEFWQGRENRLHDRIVYHPHKGGWKKKRLAP